KHYACARQETVERDRMERSCPSNGTDLLHFGNEVPEQILDAVAQGCRRARAAGAGAAHVDIDDAVAEALESNVAAVLSHGRADTGLEQFLDGLDRLFVLGREE